MKLSVIIPAHNEEDCISPTLESLVDKLELNNIDYEILVIADHCTDATESILEKFAVKNSRIKWAGNEKEAGFGMAVRAGLDLYTGDAAAIFMADSSDSPSDIVSYFRFIENGAECVFGSRFIKGSEVIDYPVHKLFLNRLVNFGIKLIFRHGYNDTTNAFKCYRREVIDGCRPFLSKHFNLTVEIPLKAFLRGYTFKIIPISWHNRKAGISKLKIKEMGSRYLFIIFYCVLEKLLSRGDYLRGR
ncbi:MAG: hypothetical protein A2017_06760 [Lentisphaerae bacterium GWF2_44_16]|nr:MAG: hypothetical protein A2017_06760 [Lentisphaerae bacterium GWF2_44_16]